MMNNPGQIGQLTSLTMSQRFEQFGRADAKRGSYTDKRVLMG